MMKVQKLDKKNKEFDGCSKELSPKKPPISGSRPSASRIVFKRLEKPIIEIVFLERDLNRSIRYFHKLKDNCSNLELNTELINDEASNSNQPECLTDTPVANESNQFINFELIKANLSSSAFSSDLEYSRSDGSTFSIANISSVITPLNLSVVDRFPKIFSDSLTISEGSNIQPEQTNRKSFIDYSESLEIDSYPLESICKDHHSPNHRSFLETFVETRTPLESPRESHLTIKDLHKQFNLLESRITNETIDGTLKSETSDYGKNLHLQSARLEIISYAEELEGKSEENKNDSCKCTKCIVF